MIRSTLFLAIAAFGFSAMDASAAEVKVAYKGVVTQANGAQASSFVPGQTVSLEYVLDSMAADTDPDPVSGVYFPDGLEKLQLKIPAAGVDTVYESGVVHAYNGPFVDYVNFESYPSAHGHIAGLELRWVNVSFSDTEAGAEGQPIMLASDAMPTSPLVAKTNSVTFRTDAGFTTVTFLAEVAEPQATCASEGYTGAKLAWCQNICEKGYTGKTLDTWIHRWIGKYRDLPYCAAEGSDTAD